MTSFMLHGLGDCTPERHCGCLDIPAMTARLAAVESLAHDWPCSDEYCDGDCTGCAYASDLRAALATTGEGQ